MYWIRCLRMYERSRTKTSRKYRRKPGPWYARRLWRADGALHFRRGISPTSPDSIVLKAWLLAVDYFKGLWWVLWLPPRVSTASATRKPMDAARSHVTSEQACPVYESLN